MAALAVLGFGGLFVASRIGAIYKFVNQPSSGRRSRRNEDFAIAAAALSAIFGVRIICEEEAQIELKKGNPDVKKLDIKDIFKKIPKDFDERQRPLYYIPDSSYDPKYDYDFTNYKADDNKCTRGDYPYNRPAGWKRKAVNVLGKYEDDRWLGKKGWRSGSSPGEWPVSFHGTKIQNVSNIVTDGYDIERCKRKLFGLGIYSTPHFEVAERYATDFNYKGKGYKCILQNRVNLEKTKIKETIEHGPYLVTPDPDNIRPYGVCFKKV